MAKKATVIPAGVLAGVLALSGGVVMLVHGSGDAPAASPSTSPTASPRLPDDLVQAARTTLSHRSLVITQDPGRSNAGLVVQMSGVADPATGDYRVSMTGQPSPQDPPMQIRYVDGVAYMTSRSVLDSFDDSGLTALPSKPWAAVQLPASMLLGASPVAALRLVVSADPDWSVRSSQPAAGAMRFSLTTPHAAVGAVERLDLDVRGGEVVRIAVHDRMPALPDCPNLPTAVVEQQNQLDDGEAVLVRGSDQPASITAPPASEVERMPGDLASIPTPAPLTCADFSSGPTTVGPPAVPSIPELPRGSATYSGPAKPSPSAGVR